jgi:hypothetical protein
VHNFGWNLQIRIEFHSKNLTVLIGENAQKKRGQKGIVLSFLFRSILQGVDGNIRSKICPHSILASCTIKCCNGIKSLSLNQTKRGLSLFLSPQPEKITIFPTTSYLTPLVHSITPPPFNNNYELFTINTHVLTKTAYVLTLYGGFD